MKKDNILYLSPQVEVIEIEIEDALLATSTESSGVSIDDLINGEGRY